MTAPTSSKLFLILFAACVMACASADDDAKGLGLDTDNNGICDSDEGKGAPSTEQFCFGNDSRCPVSKLSDADCKAACENALALIKADADCFPSFSFSPFSSLDMCMSQCGGWGACNPTYVYCFKDAKSCDQASKCRIDKAL